MLRIDHKCLAKFLAGGAGITVALPGDAHLHVQVGLGRRLCREVPPEVRRFVPALLLFE